MSASKQRWSLRDRVAAAPMPSPGVPPRARPVRPEPLGGRQPCARSRRRKAGVPIPLRAATRPVREGGRLGARAAASGQDSRFRQTPSLALHPHPGTAGGPAQKGHGLARGAEENARVPTSPSLWKVPGAPPPGSSPIPTPILGRRLAPLPSLGARGPPGRPPCSPPPPRLPPPPRPQPSPPF